MNLSQQLAKHFREYHQGSSFTGSTLQEKLEGLTWQQATTKVQDLNTIAALVFHINYYVSAVVKVLEGGPLDAHDKYSYDLPPIESHEDWEKLKTKAFADADRFAELVEQLPEARLKENFLDGKYGNYFRNLQGLIEHSYYHLGQIALLRKMVSA